MPDIEYMRIRLSQLDEYVANGWTPVTRDGRVVVETLNLDLDVALVFREWNGQ